MKLIKARVEVLSLIDQKEMLSFLEKCGRVCYKSEHNAGNTNKFLSSLIRSGHESVLEHSSITAKFTISRATSHQLVRHRLASFSQESQRYCNYANEKFDSEVTFIIPATMMDQSSMHGDGSLTEYGVWCSCMAYCELAYFDLLKKGVKPQVAREVLPNSCKTELVMTANIREWRHILKLRTSRAADDGIRYITNELLDELQLRIPVLFDDIGEA